MKQRWTLTDQALHKDPKSMALLLIRTVRAELALGTKHYRASTNELLTVEKDILQALLDSDLAFEVTPDRKAEFDRGLK